MEDGTSWTPPRWIYIFLIAIAWIVLLVRSFLVGASSKSRLPPTFQVFQDKFFNAYFASLCAYSLQNVYMEQLGESRGLDRNQMATMLCLGHAAGIFFGTPLALSADTIGRKKISYTFVVFQVLASAFKQLNYQGALYLAQICNGLSGSVLSCVFVSWMISEHEKLGFPQEWLGDTFWGTCLGGAIVALATSTASSVLVNRFQTTMEMPAALSLVAAIISAVLISGWPENVGDVQGGCLKGLRSSLQLVRDKKVAMLAILQAAFEVSLSVFWMLWLPTLVADGRDIHSGATYALFMASFLLGTAFSSLLFCGPISCLPESYLPPVLVTASGCFMVQAYDYQEVGVLVASMCVFLVCAGLIAPWLARLQSMHIPSGHRAGAMATYQVPGKLALMFFLIQGSRLHILENSTILWFCAIVNLVAAGGLHMNYITPDRMDVLKEHTAL